MRRSLGVVKLGQPKLDVSSRGFWSRSMTDGVTSSSMRLRTRCILESMKQIKVSEDMFEHTGYFEFLADALFHWNLAEARAKVPSRGPEQAYQCNRHARASISASMFSVECAANCLIESLEVETKLKLDIDKMPVLTKFDMYARLSENASLSRSDARVGRIDELTRLRNEFVHPKVRRAEVSFGTPTESDHDYTVNMGIEAEVTGSLRIPRVSSYWSNESASTVLTACTDFLAWYLGTVLRYDAPRSTSILAPRIVVDKMWIRAIPEEVYDEIRAAREVFDFRFIDVPLALDAERRNVLRRASWGDA